MSKKKKILIFIIIVVLLILILTSTYSKYVNTSEGSYGKKIGQWEIKINDTDITVNPNPDTDVVFYIDDFEWDWDSEPHVKKPKVAPGMKGNFSLKIDPTGTDVSIKYTIKIDKSVLTNVADINLAITGLEENGNKVDIDTLPEDDDGNLIIEKVKKLSEIQSENESDRIDNLKIEVTWKNDDTEETNKQDSIVGSEANRQIAMPVKVNVIQYTGDTITGDISNGTTP